MAEPNVLVLDEPTNDLDIDTLTALEDLLDSWPGHGAGGQPRPVLRRAGLRQGGRAARRRHARRAARRGRGVPGPPGGRRCAADHGRAVRETRPVGAPSAGGPAVSAADARAAKKEAGRLERRMLKLDADEKKLHEQLAAAAADYAKAAELDAQLKAVHAEKEQVEEEWLVASELAEG